MLRDDSDTIVFRHDTKSQRKMLMNILRQFATAESGLRVVAMSVDNEVTRVELIEEALERCDDHYDLRETIEAICACPDLSRWTWDEADWKWMD